MSTEKFISVKNLKTYFPIKKGFLKKTVGHVKAVDDVSFEVRKGETIGIVGESGCGKTTLGRTLCKLLEPTSGSIAINGQEAANLSTQQLASFRRQMQMIFQDPYSSLNPRLSVKHILDEPLKIHQMGNRQERDQMISNLLQQVGLNESQKNRYPHEFSGGQRQRVGIARALALKPEIIICDEAVSALDVSVQSQILNLLRQLQKEFELTYIFISHDLSVVRYISDKIAIMYLGKIVELAPTLELFDRPAHPYTKGLLSAIPIPNPTKRSQSVPLEGDIPSPSNPPTGCRFHTRCPMATELCRKEEPELKNVFNSPQRMAACHFVEGRE